jgi:plasmid stabilization system protein ParE
VKCNPDQPDAPKWLASIFAPRRAAKSIRSWCTTSKTPVAKLLRRFRKSAADTFHALSKDPLIGVARKIRKPEFQGVRMWRVHGFENYLIFYRPRSGGITVERLIHASQDFQRMLR